MNRATRKLFLEVATSTADNMWQKSYHSFKSIICPEQWFSKNMKNLLVDCNWKQFKILKVKLHDWFAVEKIRRTCRNWYFGWWSCWIQSVVEVRAWLTNFLWCKFLKAAFQPIRNDGIMSLEVTSISLEPEHAFTLGWCAAKTYFNIKEYLVAVSQSMQTHSYLWLAVLTWVEWRSVPQHRPNTRSHRSNTSDWMLQQVGMIEI